jgi:hypothetical protein
MLTYISRGFWIGVVLCRWMPQAVVPIYSYRCIITVTCTTARYLEELLDIMWHIKGWAVDTLYMEEKSSSILEWGCGTRITKRAHVEYVSRIFH